MALIPWPTCAFITNVAWTLDQPAQVNRSQWTGRRQVTILPIAAQWSAKVTFEVKADEASSLDLQAFIVDMQGQANTTLVPGTAGAQFGASLPVQVAGGGQAGFALNVDGVPGGLTFKRGQKLSLNGQMLMLMAAATADVNGNAALSIKPALRLPPADNTPVEFTNPTCRMALKNTGNGWSTDWFWNAADLTAGKPDASYTFELEFEEVFA